MSKKLNRRIDNKRLRQVERSVLHDGASRTIRSWSGWGPKLIALAPDEPPHRKKRQGKKRPPKERCPVNGKHQFLKDTEFCERDYEKWSYREQRWHWDTYTRERRFKLCVHCGKDVTLKWRRHYD